MGTPAGRPTYGGWLDQIAQEGRTDDFGLAAAAWANAQPHGRPKYHAPKSVNRWLSEHPPPGVANLQATLHQLEKHYHAQDGLPADPGAATITAGQEASEQDAQQDWFASPEGQAWLASPEGQAWAYQQHVSAGQEPVQEELYPEQPAVQPQPVQVSEVPEHPWQLVLLKLGQVQAAIDQFYQVMAPLIALARDAMAIDSSQLVTGQPTPAQARALEIAMAQGWTTGPEIPAPLPTPAQDFYGGPPVPLPDFGRMADASDGREDPE